jgi:myosin heavy subunit
MVMRKEKRERDAVRIQAAVRSFLAKCHYQNMLNHRNHAATTIQKAVRGWLCREQYQTMRERQRAAIKIQAIVKSWLVRRQVHMWHKKATLIQTVIRSWLAKRQLLRMKEEAKQRREESARSILEREALWRAKLALQQPHSNAQLQYRHGERLSGGQN